MMLDRLVTRSALPVNARAEIVRPRKPNGRCPAVSVVIPCYNYGRFLPQCVNSVLDQADVRVDVLIVDDASTDGSDQIVRELGARDTRIRTIIHTENRGPAPTYNEGLTQVTGDYAVLLSADDRLTPGCLARATSLMEEYPSVGLTYGSPVIFTDGRHPPARTTAKSWVIWQGHDWIAQSCRTGENALKSPEMVVRSSVLREIGLFRTDLPLAGDFEMWMRIAAVSDIGYIAGADQAYYRIHANNMHHTRFGVLDDFTQRLASFDAVFSEQSRFPKDLDSMRDTAHRTIARMALRQAIRDTAYRTIARSSFSRVLDKCLSGTVGDETVNEYTTFALKTWPDAKRFSEWRILDKLSEECDGSPKLSPSLLARMAVRKLRTRTVLWRRKLVGV
jgi:glycosyltransferase involved in cell wall biosynthesis